jgi:phosphoglycolate phosphatase/AHBA synthesis associated protein
VVLFDLDGVLVRSEEAWFHLMEECGRVFRGSPITREEFAPTFGQSTADDVASFALRCTTEQLDAFYAENFARFAAHIQVDPEARPVLAALAARETALAVVTNTATRLATEILKRADLLPFFQAVACSDQVPHGKPAPDIVHHALALLGRSAEAACLVGDSRFDREAARAAGVRFIGLRIDGDQRVESLLRLVD